MSWTKRLGRALKRALLTLLALLAGVFVLALVTLGTQAGRNLLLSRVLPFVNDAIPGTLQVRDFSDLSLDGLELRGIVVLDPAGRKVVVLEQLLIDCDLTALRPDDLRVTRVQLERGFVDLREIGAEHRGLVAAFVDPDAPASPPSPGPPPYVLVEAIAVDAVSVRLPQPAPVAPTELRDVKLRGTFELDATPRARVDSLTLGVVRESKPVARLSQFRGLLGRGAEPSRAALKADVSGISLELKAEGVAPPAKEYESAPLRATLRIAGVTPERVARLARDASLKSKFEGPLSLDASLKGTLPDLHTRVKVTSPGGPLELTARLKGLKELEFRLASAGFNPGRVVSDAPKVIVAAHLASELNIADAPGSLPVHSLRLRDASVDGEPLPRLDASGRVTKRALEKLTVDLADAHSKVHATGRAGFDGSAALKLEVRLAAPTLRRLALLAGRKEHIDGTLHSDLKLGRTASGTLNVSGTISARRLAFGKDAVEQLNLAVAVAGTPPDLSGHVEMQAAGVSAGEIEVSTATLDLRGGPKQYTVKLSGRSNQGDVDLGANVEREGSELVLDATLAGRRDGHAFGVEVLTTRLNPAAQSVHTEGVTISFRDQSLKVRGSASRKEAALVVQAKAVDLAAFGPLLPKDAQLEGTLTLAAEFRGNTERPELALDLEGRGVRVGERPAFNVDLSGELSAREGTSSLKLEVRDQVEAPHSAQLRIVLDADSRFATGVPWIQALASAEHRARLELATLDLALLQKLLVETNLPVAGRVKAELELRGPVSAPNLNMNLNAELEPAWTKRRLSVTHELSLQDQRLDLQLNVADAQGSWLETRATTSLPPIAELLKRPKDLLASQRWRVRTQLSERTLDALPIPMEQRDSLPSATLAGSLDAAHEPGEEPELDLSVVLRQKGAIETGPGCKTQQLRLDADLSLEHGKLRLKVLGRQRTHELLNVDASAPLRLTRALAGKRPELGPISAKLRSQGLDLRSLPYVCERFGGRVDLTAELDDPLGSNPDARAELAIHDLTAGSQISVDTRVEFFLKRNQAGLDAKVRHGIHSSTATARVPVTFRDGRLRIDEQAAARGELRLVHLPIEPFLDPEGAISYATGTLSGQAKLTGSLKRPKLSGSIELEKLGVTATDMAQPLRNIEGRIQFSQDRVKLVGLKAEDKEGTLRLDGDLNLADTQRIRGDFRLRAKEFPLRQQGQVVATTDVDARIESTLTPEKNSIHVTLHEVDTWLENTEIRKGIALLGHPDVVVDGVPAREPEKTDPAPLAQSKPKQNEKPTAEPANAAERAKQARDSEKLTEIVLDASDKFWVKRDDFAVKLAAQLTAQIRGEEVRVEGAVDIDRGYLSLFGKVFAIQRGSSLEFIGSATPNPVLSIEAIHENRRSAKNVKVRITGRGDAPELAFFVDDVGVTAGDAFVALFGSQQSNQDPDAAGGQARDFVGGLTAGILATTARRELGSAAPIVMVEPGGGEETRVRAGFELDSLVPRFLRPMVTGLYFEGIVANDQEASTQDANVNGGALLEVYFPHDFFTTGQYGPGSTWSVDLGWQL